ncbi:UNKNOWN [Stylonychia lemnae]|uniref:Uncharacterized protein n=1 Tax=Stylonychia lemnae TaxID=5949 RepID=A0A078ARQ7_STYLE|nr:UNKNOWN [Stylonychia lemnae]|eukprot:CDW84671.1 UNKNOWN [Stylonychia lemnae]
MRASHNRLSNASIITLHRMNEPQYQSTAGIKNVQAIQSVQLKERSMIPIQNSGRKKISNQYYKSQFNRESAEGNLNNTNNNSIRISSPPINYDRGSVEDLKKYGTESFISTQHNYDYNEINNMAPVFKQQNLLQKQLSVQRANRFKNKSQHKKILERLVQQNSIQDQSLDRAYYNNQNELSFDQIQNNAQYQQSFQNQMLKNKMKLTTEQMRLLLQNKNKYEYLINHQSILLNNSNQGFNQTRSNLQSEMHNRDTLNHLLIKDYQIKQNLQILRTKKKSIENWKQLHQQSKREQMEFLDQKDTLIGEELIKVNKLSAKKPRASDPKRLNQDLKLVSHESTGVLKDSPKKIVTETPNETQRDSIQSYLIDQNSVQTKDKSQPPTSLQSPQNQLKVDITNKSDYSYSINNPMYPILNQQRANSVNTQDDGYSQITIKNIEFGEEYPKSKELFRSFRKEDKSPPVIDYQTDLIKKISLLKQLHLNQSVSYQGPSQRPQLRVIHSNIGSVDLENYVHSPLLNNSQQELRENSPEMSIVKRKRSIKKNNSHMNKSIDYVPILGHQDSTYSQAKSHGQYHTQEQRERRRLKVIETQFSNQNSLVTLKYQILNKTMANGFRDNRIQKVLLYDKTNFNQFKNFEGTGIGKMIAKQQVLSRRSNSIEEAPESSRSSQVFNEDLFPQLSLNDQAYNKYRSLELRQFISSKLHFNQSSVNFNNKPPVNNKKNQESSQQNDYIQSNSVTLQSRQQSPQKSRMASHSKKRQIKNSQQEYLEELRKITSQSVVDKPYNVSLLYNNTYDEKAKKIQVPINILEQFIPPGKEFTQVNY